MQDLIGQEDGMNTMKRKSNRRSSILKVPRPLDEVQNYSSDEKYQKNKRVSFANTVQIKDYCGDQPTVATTDDFAPRDENALHIPDDGDTVIQMSTPSGKKRRRISVGTGSKFQRLSIIPKLETSFCLTEDDYFEVYEDDQNIEVNEMNQMTVSKVTTSFNDHSSATNEVTSASLIQNGMATQSMDITAVQPATTQQHSSSLLSPDSLLNVTGSTAQESITSPKSTTTNSMKKNDQSLCASDEQTDQAAKEKEIFDNKLDGTLNHTEPPHSEVSTLDLTCGDVTEVQTLSNDEQSSTHHLSLCSATFPCANHDLSMVTKKQHTCMESKLQEDVAGLYTQMQISLTSEKHANACKSFGQADTAVGDSMPCSNNTNNDQLGPDQTYSIAMNGSDYDQNNVTHIIPEHKTIICEVHENVNTNVCLEQVSLVDDSKQCDNWLNTSDNHFLDDASVLSLSFNSTQGKFQCQHVQAALDECPSTLAPVAPPENILPITPVSNLTKKTLSKIKQSQVLNSSAITSPEATLAPSLEPKYVERCPVGDDDSCEITITDKSIISSPSVYSKFCAILGCDKTILDATHLTSPQHEQSLLQGQGARVAYFHLLLQQLETRLLEMVKSLQMRLHNVNYTNCHQAIVPSLKILLNASTQASCAVSLLTSYGKVAGLYEQHEDGLVAPCPSDIPCMTLPSDEDITGSLSTKVWWFSQMNALLSEVVYPAVEEAMGIAQCLYKWTLTSWNKEGRLQLTLAKDHDIIFQLFHQDTPSTGSEDTSPVMRVQSVHIQSSSDENNSLWKVPLIECMNLSDISKAVLEAQKSLLASNSSCTQ